MKYIAVKDLTKALSQIPCECGFIRKDQVFKAISSMKRYDTLKVKEALRNLAEENGDSYLYCEDVLDIVSAGGEV